MLYRMPRCGLRHQDDTEPSAERMARQTFSGVSGMSSGVLTGSKPSGASASSTALTTAGGAETQPDSPIPLAPSGLYGDGVDMRFSSQSGSMLAFGTAYSSRVPVSSWPSSPDPI